MQNKPLFEAVIFDLDGVITKTALVHSSAWKQMFDDYLRYREKTYGEPFREFTQKDDYLPYVDGKPRYDGVRSFLESRNIHLEFGAPSDNADKETICGLGNKKNITFNEVLARHGVSVYESTVAFIHELKKLGIKIGVASSSKNCEAVLQAANLSHLIETRVDGVVSAELGLKGKPEPDIFVTAANNLGVKPAKAIVVEDATSGVAAGKAGNFGLVLGLAREENTYELLINGADIVLEDMAETSMEKLNEWFEKGIDADNWQIRYYTYEPEKERTREALLAVGNGYMGTRGAMDEVNATPTNYPGTYIAGLYNKLSTPIAGKDIWNEDFVNAPNWLPISFKINDGEWFDINNAKILFIERTLHLKTGELVRKLKVSDDKGRETEIVSSRFAAMHDKHLAAQKYVLKPLNYDGKITLRTGLNGHLINTGVERYKSLNQQHLQAVDSGVHNNFQYLLVKTTQSNIQIAEVAVLKCFIDESPSNLPIVHDIKPDTVFSEISCDLKSGQSLKLSRKVVIYTSKPDDVKNPLQAAREHIARKLCYTKELAKSAEAWQNIWDKMDMQVTGDRFSQKLLRLHLYHLLVSMSPNNKDIDASITARGLHGEAYRGHIFWDELFILPLYNFNLPEVAKSMLMYRYRRLGKAEEYAKEYGYKGAMFPWQSGSDGSEETQIIHLNPLSGKWDPDHSSLQRHVSLAVAFNIWQYFLTTNDLDFMKSYGIEMFFKICRFWASKCTWNAAKNRYDLTKVMGPDEFHEQYPDSAEGGLTNNAYTNLMTAWAFGKAQTIITILGNEKDELLIKLGFTAEELSQWEDISRKLFLEINSDGIIAQYEGYFELKELDWDYYKQKYGNIYRMDRILKAEGLSPDEYKVSKQADMLMTFYNLEKEEVDVLLQQLGYPLPDDYLQRNLDYYFRRTSHGSTLSRIVHARLASLAANYALSWQLYSEALASDYVDIQGGTTAEGIHAGVMAGTVLIALSTFAGLSYNSGMLKFSPRLPEKWKNLSFGITFRDVRYQCEISKTRVKITTDKNSEVWVGEKHYLLIANNNYAFEIQ